MPEPIPTATPTRRIAWVWLLTFMLAPAAATSLSVLLGGARNEVAPGLSLIGGALGGMGAGVILGCRFGGSSAMKVVLGIIFGGVCAVASIVMAMFGCLATGFQLNLH